MWLRKVKESQQFQFFLPLMPLIFMLMIFNPLIKVLLFVPQCEPSLSSPLLEEQTYFSFQVHLFTKEGIRKVEEFTFRAKFVLLTVSCWVSEMNEHSLWIHISQLFH